MWKSLAILAVFLTVAQASVPAAWQTANKGASDAKEQDQTANDSKNPSQATMTISPKKAGRGDYQPASEKASENNYQSTISIAEVAPVPEPWPWHDKWLWGANILLVLVGFGTLGILWRQTNHIVASDRAWMITKIYQPEPQEILSSGNKPTNWYLPIQVAFTNRGKTPAIAISGLLEYSSERTVDPQPLTLDIVLPKTPKYHKTPTKYAPGSVYVTGDDTFLIVAIPRDFLLRENADWVSGGKCLCVKGYLRYKDVFRENHISRFCFAYQITQIGGNFANALTGKQVLPPEFQKAGPPIYNEIT
ncbi:MAG: hypothetical protein WA708_07680 [Acidobacteriaceae bacterium]